MDEVRFVLILAGTFVMGSPMNEARRRPDKVPCRVVISRPFYLSSTEVNSGGVADG